MKLWTVIQLRPAALPAFDPEWLTPCKHCANYVENAGSRCGLTCNTKAPAKGSHPHLCIDVRAVDGICGPRATKWKAA